MSVKNCLLSLLAAAFLASCAASYESDLVYDEDTAALTSAVTGEAIAESRAEGPSTEAAKDCFVRINCPDGSTRSCNGTNGSCSASGSGNGSVTCNGNTSFCLSCSLDGFCNTQCPFDPDCEGFCAGNQSCNNSDQCGYDGFCLNGFCQCF